MALPMLQPHQIVAEPRLVVSTEPGAALLNVKHADGKWSVEREWDTNRFRPGFNDFVVHDGFMYGFDDGIICAFDLSTGERVWKKGRIGHGQLLVLPDQDVLVASSNRGAVVLIAADPKEFRELARFEAIEGKTWNGPVIDGQGRLFLRNGEEMAAYDIGLQQPPAGTSASDN
jgi:outer membrane protein assembly factor BamB